MTFPAVSRGKPMRVQGAHRGVGLLLLASVLLVKIVAVRLTVFDQVNPIGLMAGETGFALLVAAMADMRRRRDAVVPMSVDLVLSGLLLAALMYNGYFGVLPSLYGVFQMGETAEVGASIAMLFRPAHLLLFVTVPLWPVLHVHFGDFVRAPASRPLRAVALTFGLLTAVANIAIGAAAPDADLTMMAWKRGILNAQVAEVVRGVLVPSEIAGADEDAALKAEVERLRGEPPPGVAPASVAAADLGGRNVVFILVESLQGLALDARVGGRRVTPNLARLASEGIDFRNAYMQVGAGSTSDAEYISVTGGYPLEDLTVSYTYADREIPSFLRGLRELGYTTMTFHTNESSFFNRDQFYPALGYDEFRDKAFFGDEDFLWFGASDDVLFSKSLPLLKERAAKGKPFFAYFVTMSSHHPYTLPRDKRSLSLPPQLRDTFVGDYLDSMSYADAAIGRFLEGLEDAGLHEDTVIVVMGDHHGLAADALEARDESALEWMLGQPYSHAEQLRVACMIVAPGAIEPTVVVQPVGQVDIAPTLASLLGVDLRRHVVFGRDLTKGGQAAMLGVRHHAPTGTYIDDLVVFIPGETSQTWELFDSRTRVPTSAVVSEAVRERSRSVILLQRMSDVHLGTLGPR